MNNPLFACSKCFRKFPFEEISQGDMSCGDCRTKGMKAKCTYCRSEYQQSGKSSSSICPKCTENVKLYGKPNACSLCSINAAFKSDKCSRCLSSMNKYGPPIKCEICQQTCAFNRSDLRIDGKLHCWLCKLSYKRALAKAKKSDMDKHKDRAKKRSSEDMKSGSIKLSNQSSSNRNNSSNPSRDLSKDMPEKIAKTTNVIAPSHTSDHVVALTQLREQIATLQKKLQQKDNQLLQKDKEITEWKGKHFTLETEMRNKMTDQKKIFDTKLDMLNKKIQQQQVQIATLSKSTKRSTKESVKEREKDSGSDSPNTN